MIITSIKTRILLPPKDDLLGVIKESLPRLEEKTIVAVTSKVVSIWQGRCIPREQFSDKDKLVAKEADWYLPREAVPGRRAMLTLKHNVLVPTAGVDESNGNGYYILWPRDTRGMARTLYQWVRQTYRAKHCGIIITDSHSVPLRRGTIGLSLAHYGFLPLKDYRGTRDLFGRKLVVTQANVVDSLAAAAVLAMGEGDEGTPLALISDIPFVAFSSGARMSRKPFSSLIVDRKEDLYAPLLRSVSWKRGGGGIGSLRLTREPSIE